MSLDRLFQQILQTEQQFTEQTQKIKAVKIDIIKCNENIKTVTERNEKSCEELAKKAQHLSAMRLQRDLMKKCEDQMLKQIEELLCQKSHLRERLAKIKKELKEEEENFLQEILQFNNDFSLPGNRETMLENQAHTELLDLEREEESLHQEMELMSCRNSHMSSIQEQKKHLQLELRCLDSAHRDLDQRLQEAAAVTESLRAECLFVSQKPLTDSTCLRLRKELEFHKEGEVELLKEALSSEIQLLKSKLDSSQQH